MSVECKVGDFNFMMDKPGKAGGADKGPAPMDMVTAALIGCAGITLSIVAKQVDFTFTNAYFEAEGSVDPRGFMGIPGVCKHFCDFKGRFVIESSDSDDKFNEVVRQLESRCPVFSLLHDAGVNTKIEWVKKTEG
jgi:uncharacterized OsmC-like protein